MNRHVTRIAIALFLSSISSLSSCDDKPKAAPVVEAPSASASSASSPASAAASPLSPSPSAEENAAPPAISPSNVEGPRAQWVDLAGVKSVRVDLCSQVFVAVARGKVWVVGRVGDAGSNVALSENDIAIITRPAAIRLDLRGNGLVLVANFVLEKSACDPAQPPPATRVVNGASTPKLTWAHGAMSAWLDVGADVSPSVYVGRLEGTAPVAEHVHDGSWEILASIDASGTLTLDGVEKHLGARDIAVIPPNTKHAWKPDPGTTLRAIQIYSPRGPEERFKKLAAAEH